MKQVMKMKKIIIVEAVKNRLREVNADVQVEQEEYDEIVQIKAMFLNHDYQ